jgi:hypothetical protein
MALALAAATDVACIDTLGVPSPERLVPQAIAVLRGAGLDPADYRLELRLEDRDHPDGGNLESVRVMSAVFLPRRAGHALRVHPGAPCALGWVWDPAAFTPWQRDVLERAAAAAAGVPETPGGPLLDVQVLETRDHVTVETSWRERPGAPPLRVVLRKSDLAVLE